MAAAMFEELVRVRKLPGAWHVASAGTWAQDGNRASANGQDLMKSWNLDISRHRSRIVRSGLLPGGTPYHGGRSLSIACAG